MVYYDKAVLQTDKSPPSLLPTMISDLVKTKPEYTTEAGVQCLLLAQSAVRVSQEIQHLKASTQDVQVSNAQIA